MRTQVSIELQRTSGTRLYFREDEAPVTVNVSNADKIFDTDDFGSKGFQLSKASSEVVSSLDGSYHLYSSQGYSGYVSSEICDSSGMFLSPVPFSFTLDNERPAALFILFDVEADEYARVFKIKYGDKVINIAGNNSSIVIIDPMDLLLPIYNDGSAITVEIVRWSKPHKSAKIMQISPALTSKFTGKDLQEFTCSENTTGSQLQIEPGIVEQYADISVYDRYGFIHKLASHGALVEDMNVTVAAVDNDGSAYTLGTYLVSSWDVDANSLTVKIECRDMTSQLSKINVPLQPIKNRTLHDMLVLAFQNITNTPWEYVDEATRAYCENIYTPNSWFRASTADKLLHKICILGMLRIYWSLNKYIITRC